MKKNRYNPLLILLLCCVGVLSIISCDVDVNQEDSRTTGELTEQDVVLLANSVKDVLKWQSSSSPTANSHTFPHIFQEIRGGNAVSEATPVNWITARDYNQFSTITPTQRSVHSYWSKWYKGINRANISIKRLTEIAGFSNENLKKNLIAQSKFFRALYYFELAKHYGAVPIRLEAVETLQQATIVPRAASVDAVYDVIIKDLKEAVVDLENNPAEKYEATQGAVYALLAKVSLYKKEYQKAVEYADMVTGYRLESNFVDNFRLATEGSRVETILEVQYVSGQSSLGFESADETVEIKGSGAWQMFAGIGGVNNGWNNMIPTQEFVDFFEEGDDRKLGTLVVAGEPQEGLTGTQTASLSSLPAGAIQRKIYLTPDETQDLVDTGNRQQSDVNDIVLRYADVLLIKAEAQIKIGGAGAGDVALQQIVERAKLVSSGNYDMEDIKYNRRAELSFEGWDRFTDLVRWGDAATVLSEKGFKVQRDELLPIPQIQIEQAGGIVKQNPGY